MSARWSTCVSHTYTHMYTRRITSIRDSRGERGGGKEGVEGWYTFWLKKGAEKRTARIKWRRIEEVSRIFAFRNAADIWKCSPGAMERDGRKKRTFSRERGVREEGGRGKNCLFYGVELRRTILSPTKWPGSIFGSLSSPLPLSLLVPPFPPLSLSFSLFLSLSRFFFSLFFRSYTLFAVRFPRTA